MTSGTSGTTVTTTRTESVQRSWHSGRSALLVLAVTLVAVVLVRVHRFDLPLERDEGEYAYGARLMLHGDFSYETLRTMKLPGVHATTAVFFALFGETDRTLRGALLAIDLASAAFLFLVVRRLFDASTAALSATAFLVLGMTQALLGLFAHVENFAIAPMLAGVYVFLRARESARPATWLASGVLFGVAFVMKQPAALFGLAAALVIVFDVARKRTNLLRSLVPFAVGAVLPLGIVCAIFAANGTFGALWFMTVTYARSYLSEITFADGLGFVRDEVEAFLRFEPAFVVLALVGFAWPLLRSSSRAKGALTVGFFALSFVAVSPGLFFRAHYFVFVLPALSIAVGTAARRIGEVFGRTQQVVSNATVAFAAVIGFACEWSYLVAGTPTFYPNPFVEAPELARRLRELTSPNESIAVLGSEPEIAFYADRKSATGFVYMYPLMELHPYAAWMQEQAIADIERSKPRYLLFVHVGQSWTKLDESQTKILEWYLRVTRNEFKPVLRVDLAPYGESQWNTGAAASTTQPSGKENVYLYERK